MKNYFLVTIILISAFITSGFVTADKMPLQMPENQIFSIDTTIESTGIHEDTSSMKWIITSPNETPSGILGPRQLVSESTYKDTILTNGGHISENKNFDFKSKSQGKTGYNVVDEKVITYTGSEGAHMTGEEEYMSSNAGNWTTSSDEIRCVFSTIHAGGYPAFCNIVSAKSNLININSAKISTKGQIRSVGSVSTPAQLNYRIAVTPDSNSGSGFAKGTVKTMFAGSIMEARDYRYPPYWNKTAAENSWKDSSEVFGGIKNFKKTFDYKSGLQL